MLYSCLIYFENFATELTLINELSVVSNKLCVGYIDWERLGGILENPSGVYNVSSVLIMKRVGTWGHGTRWRMS